MVLLRFELNAAGTLSPSRFVSAGYWRCGAGPQSKTKENDFAPVIPAALVFRFTLHPMHTDSTHLFPHRLTRRDFLKMSAASAAALAAPSLASAGDADPVKFGTGAWTYTLDRSWGKLPDGMKFGLGCGIVVDSRDRVIVTSRSGNPCVAIFGADGKLEETWSDDFAKSVGLENAGEVAGTAHGIYWSKEPE